MKSLSAAGIAAIVVAASIASALAAWTVQGWRMGQQLEAAEVRHTQAMLDLEQTGREAVDAARAEEQRRTAEVQKAVDEANQVVARARADADSAVDAGERLRNQLAALTASCRAAAGHTGPAVPGAPADATADLLADVQRRIDEATERIAGFADLAHAAGSTCERIHDGLNR